MCMLYLKIHEKKSEIKVKKICVDIPRTNILKNVLFSISE